jgi:SAM-dependent methyltransferase
MDVEAVGACPFCGSTWFRRWRPAPDRAYGTGECGFAYAKCKACDIRFLARRPTALTASELYDDRYEPYDVGTGDRMPPIELSCIQPSVLPAPWLDLLRLLYRPPTPGARLLDLGCGSAHFLGAAYGAGWTPIGADFSPAVVERVRIAGIDAHLVDDVWEVLKDNPVDRVRMNHVLEHVYDPVKVLTQASSVLRPGGLIHVAVPNPVGFSSTVFRRHWLGLEPRHVFLFPPGVLVKVVERAGLKVLGLAHQGAPNDARRSIGYALAAAQVPATIRAIGLSRGAGRVYAVPAAIAAALGRGDRLHAVLGR